VTLQRSSQAVASGRRRWCRRAHLHAWALTRSLRATRAQLTDIVVDALATIRRPDVPIDLHMVEARSFLNARALLCSSVR
jgi:hypothetical protein